MNWNAEWRHREFVFFFLKKSIPNNVIVTFPPKSLQCHLPDPEWKVYPGGPTPAPKLQLLHHLPRGNQNLWSHSGTLARSSVQGQWLACSLAVWWGHWSYWSQNTPCVRKFGSMGPPTLSLPCAAQALSKPISVTLEASTQVPVLSTPVLLWWLRKCFHLGKLQYVITIEPSCAFLFCESPLLAEPPVSHRHSCFSDYWNFLWIRRKALSLTALLCERMLTAA